MAVILKNNTVAASAGGLPNIEVTGPLDPVITAGTMACFDCSVPLSLSQNLDPIPVSTTWVNLAGVDSAPARSLMPTGDIDLTAASQISRDTDNGIEFDAGTQHLGGFTAGRDYVAANNNHGYFFSYWFKLNSTITNAVSKFSFVGGLGDANSAGNSMVLMYMDHDATDSFVLVVNGMRLTTTVTPGDLVHVAAVHDYPNGSGIVYLNGSSTTASPGQSAVFGDLQFGVSPYWDFRIGPNASIAPADWQISQDNARFTAYRYVMEDLTVSGRTPAAAIAAERAAGLAKPWAS